MSSLISVIIPTYNGEKTIRRAIDSVLIQDYPSMEVIVVDDGSSDATTEIVMAYNRSEVRLRRLPCNYGECGALNEGIDAARGEFIAFLDHDDEWLPGKLSAQIKLLKANPDAVMVACGCRMVDKLGTIIAEFGTRPPLVDKNQVWRFALAHGWIGKQTVLVRASAFQSAGRFDTTLPIGDQDMLIRLAMIGEVEFVDEYLVIQHDTHGSLSKRWLRYVDRFILPMVQRHIASRVKELSRNEIKIILGERYTSTGRILYLNHKKWRGAICLGRAVVLGVRVKENLWYLFTAAPPTRFLKRLLRFDTQEKRTVVKVTPSQVIGGSLLTPSRTDLAEVSSTAPVLLVTVDTEAEFDWSGPRARTHNGVRNVRQQMALHALFSRLGVRPTYLVDYAVASEPESYEPLRELASGGRCEIGAHLQSWETPPFIEELTERNSFNQNLPAWLQKEKLLRLTEAIQENIGVPPVCYRAGRYGVGEEIAWIMSALGYQIDLSALPGIDLVLRHGPDFRRTPNKPYWFGEDRNLLEIPLTVDFCGLLSRPLHTSLLDARFFSWISNNGAPGLHIGGALARLGLFERIALTPEGVMFEELKRLTRALLRRGNRVFVLSYHSSSLIPGYTPYVRSPADLDQFIHTITSYLDFFIGELCGVSMTPSDLRAALFAGKADAISAGALTVHDRPVGQKPPVHVL